MPAFSLKSRVLISLFGNLLRSLLGFATAIVIARGLSPAGYGDLMFLLGSFTALRSLMDLGSSSAFYTFIAQRSHHPRFFVFYYGWLALQLLLTLSIVALFAPSELFQKIWVGHELSVVFLAAIASFTQLQLWPSIGQIADSERRTLLSQASALLTGLVYLVIVALLITSGLGQVPTVLWAITLVYAFSTFATGAYLIRGQNHADTEALAPRLGEVVREFVGYCRPLALLAIIAFAYDFADKWLLQQFAGAKQQGYFQIANQLAAVCLIATTSILSILWKEIAAARKENNHAQVERLYRKSSRALVFLGAFISGMLVPWAEVIVRILLGPAYAQAWPVLALMLLYPIHQSLGQIGGITLFATGQTRTYLWVSASMMLLSIPISLVLLSPSSGGLVSGLGLGAIGLAIKLVALNILGTNVQSYAIARQNGWRFDWMFQPIIIGLMIASGYLSWWFGNLVSHPASLELDVLIAPALLSLLLHCVVAGGLLLLAPQLAGMEKHELTAFSSRLKKRYSWS